MHPLHTYIAGRLAEHLDRRRVVVFYDPREEFDVFIRELPSSEKERYLPTVDIDGSTAYLAEYDGSFFKLRLDVEPIVSADAPDPLLIYIPGEERDRHESVLMELEKGGICYEPQLKRLARHVMRDSYTEGQIDTFLAPDTVSYEDIAHQLRQAQGTDAPSLLRALYEDHTGIDLIAEWLSAPNDDARISEKQAAKELYQLIETRLGLSIDAGTSLDDARNQTARYLLLNEFRMDLDADAPASLSGIPAPATDDHRRRIRKLTDRLRETYPDPYQTLADQVEKEFRLPSAAIEAQNLGCVDTFQFEANVILEHAGAIIAEGDYARAQELIQAHRESYWVQRDVSRQSQWEAVRLMASLGHEIEEVRAAMKKERSADQWLTAYTEEGGWYAVDAAQRTLEDWIANMGQEPRAERALGTVRQAYEVLVGHMAEGFTDALNEGGWDVDAPLSQTTVYQQFVKGSTGSTAYILADALRYEMGIELSRQLEAAQDLKVRPAVAQLPTATTVGMAALLPEASKSFTVVEKGGKLAAEVEGHSLKDLNDRLTMLRGSAPNFVDLRLEDVLQYSSKKLAREINEASLILVRSQEIDALGEQGLSHLARQVMGTVIGNIGRAVRKLADAGIDSFVITSDHGYQFARKKGDDMKIEAPGGDTVKLGRRCWAGHGGKTPPATVRVRGADLGYETDLDFVFPQGAGVFKSGGDLSYHHGGPSLQELAVPVLHFRMSKEEESKQQSGLEVEIVDEPGVITNRTFPVRLRMHGDLFLADSVPLRIVLLSGDEQVGEARMATDATIDEDRGLVLMEQTTEATVIFIVTRDDVQQLRIVVQDPESGSVFASSDPIEVNLSI